MLLAQWTRSTAMRVRGTKYRGSPPLIGDAEPKLPRKKVLSGLSQMLLLGKPECARLAAGGVFLLLGSLSTLALPRFVGNVIDDVTSFSNSTAAATSDSNQDKLNRTAVELMAIVAVTAAATALRAYCFNYSGQRVVARLRQDVYRGIIRQEVAYFDTTRTGDLTADSH